MVQGYDWDIVDTYAAQSMCPYETVSTVGVTTRAVQVMLDTRYIRLTTIYQAAYGFSRFCSLFTYEEWIGFSYSVGMFAHNL